MTDKQKKFDKLRKLDEELHIRYGDNITIKHYAGSYNDETHVLYIYPSQLTLRYNCKLDRSPRKIIVNKTDYLLENIRYINFMRNCEESESLTLTERRRSAKIQLQFSIKAS